MEFKSVVDAIESLIPSNADSVYGIKEGEAVSVDEVQGIYNGETFSIWKKQKYYYVTFHSNSGAGSMEDQTIMVGVATPLSSSLFTKLGYLFSGWSKSTDGEKAYSDGESVTDAAAAGETLALYALWNAITWYVKFNANGGSGSMANQAHKYDTEKALTANAFSRSNHTFIGWSTSSGGTKIYDDKQNIVNLSSVHGGIVNLYAKWVQTVTEFVYTGDIQKFTVPETGKYKLEVWGAQGGAAGSTAGGKGGYAYGNVNLTKGQVIYVVVGGQGESSAASEGSTTKTKAGGYNGGGSSSKHVYSNDEDSGFQQAFLGGGGGCTHIGTFNKTLAAQGSKTGLYIVAGGGGGAIRTHDGSYAGGAGGGTSGGNGTTYAGNYVAKGGSQTAAGSISYPDFGTNKGGFGKGDSASEPWSYYNAIGGGGGGLYGGGAGWGNSGAGGSGYIGGCISGTTGMSNGIRSGNGRAVITFLGVA